MNIELRQIDEKDWDFILDLRNSARKHFFQNEEITKKNHYNYMKKNSINPKFNLWIVHFEKQNLGYVRLLDTEISVVIFEKYRGKGIGNIALKMCMEKCKKLGIDKLTAIIRTDNLASLNMYSKLGFIQTKFDLEKKFMEIYL